MRNHFPIIAILYFLNLGTTSAQQADKYPSQGIIKTSQGILIYNNIEEWGGYVLELNGKINDIAYPFITFNDKPFQLQINSSNQFGKDENVILKNYREWEQKAQEANLHRNILVTHKTYSYKNKLFDFWQYSIPVITKSKKEKRYMNSYFLDFVQKEIVFSFSLTSMIVNNKEANDFLLGLYNSLRFYADTIDVNTIREQIINGVGSKK
jgi:hypothetical protein